MSLNNVDSSNGYLEATAADGYAVSKPIVQDTGIDISESIVSDVGLVNELVSETDIVFIKKIDNSFNKLTVGAVTEIAALETKSAIHTDYTTDGHTILTSSTSINNNYPFWRAMNGTNIATSGESAGLGTYTTNQWMEYTFPASEIITRVRINGRVDQLAGNKIEQLKVYVWDGASFVLLHTETFTLDWALLEIRNVDFVNTTSSTKYRFEFVGDGGSYAVALSWFELLGASASKYQFDTTSVTLGEVPSAIFKADTFDGNFSGIKNISADFELVNISTATVADTLTTDETIVDGDNLVIVKDDDSIHEVVASGVVSLTDNLVAFYPLNTDSSECTDTFDGTDTSMTYSGQVAEFNGTSSFIDSVSMTGIETGDMTYSCWIKSNNNPSAGEWIMNDSTGTVNRGILVANGLIYGVGRDSSLAFKTVSFAIGSTDILNTNHVVFIQRGTVIELYVNGVQIDTLDILTLPTYNSEFKIGVDCYFPTQAFYDGEVSNARIYHDAKDQAFIDNLYAEGEYTPNCASHQMDTTAITAGEIPSKVFTVDSKVSFNDGTGFIYPSELGNDYLAVTGAAPAPDLTPGLVSHYLLSNNADDSFGSYDGTPSGGVDFQGDVASFDGVDGEVNIGALSISPTFTISAWIHLNNATERYSIVSDDNSVNLPRIFQLSINATTGTLNYLHFDASQNVTINISGTTNLSGGLHHVVATFNQVSGVSVIYVDGILESTDTNSTIRALSSNPMIGVSGVNQNIPVYFDGEISNVRIYSDAKDQTFIDDLYTEGYYPESVPEPITDGLIAHYLLNNNAHDSHGVYDASTVTDINFQGDKAQFSLDTSLILSPVSLDNALGTTVSCFIVLDSYVTRYQTVFIGESSLQLSIIPSNDATYPNKVYLSKAGGGFTSIISSFPLELDVTYHLVAMYDKNTVSFYINKVLVGSASYTGTLPNTPTYIGHYENEGTINDGNTLSGRISNFRIYNEAKDQTFIDALYAEGYYPKPLPLPTTVGLIAHYPLTGTAEDSTGNYDGTENGNIYVDDAEFGSVADFDGVSSYIQLLPIPAVTEFALSLWVKKTSDGLWDSAFTDNVSINPRVINAHFPGADGNCYFDLGDASTTGRISTPWNVAWSNKFTHIVMTSSATEYSVYINGTLIETKASILTSLQGLVIDLMRSKYANTYAIGGIRDVRIYDRYLPQQEITDIYNYENNFRPIDIDDGLIAYYPLANNSLDNYYNEYDGVDTSMTYDGLSAVFGGDPDYIELPDNFTEAQGAICFWLKNGSGQILGLNDSSTSNDLVYIAAGNGLTVRFKATGIATDNTIQDIGDIIDTTIYNHYMVQSDGSKYQVFINGVEREVNMSAGTNNGNWFNSLNASLIDSNTLGKTTFNLADYWGSGAMSHFRRYNKALTAEQVAVIYNTEKRELVPDGISLTNTRQYDDIVVDGRSIETKVELKSIADKCIEVSADLWKNP